MCDSTPIQREASRRDSARIRRYLVTNLLLLLAIGLLWGIVYPARQPLGTAQEQVVAARLAEVFSSLPDTVGPWRARELHLSQQVAQALRHDWAAARDYTLDNERISLFVFRARSEKAFLLRAHTPYSCALAQGWQNVSVHPETVTVAKVPVAVQRMVAEKDGVRHVVFYWEFPGWHLDGRGQRVADVYTVRADSVVTASSNETAELLREFLASLQPGNAKELAQGQPGLVVQPVGEDAAVQLLALDFASRSIRPGSTLRVTSWWRDAQGGYVEVQLVRGKRKVWAEQRWQIQGGGRRQQRVDLAITVPGEAPTGRYDFRLALQPSPGGERKPFVNPEGALTTEVLEPVVVKPRNPPEASELAIQHRLDAALGEEIALLGHDSPSCLEPGRPLSVTLYWQTKQRTDTDYVVFLHLLRQNGQLVAHHDSWPLENRYPTSVWDAGEIVADTHTLDTTDLPPANYQIEVGMYDIRTFVRLPVYVDGLPTEENRVLLPPVVVKPRNPLEVSELAIQHRLDAALGEEIVLLGYELSSCLEPGRPLSVTLYWQAKQRMDIDYTVFVHLLGQNGQLVAHHDSWPSENRYPTSVWDAGEIVADTHPLDTTGLPPANNQIEVGMYDLHTMVRLPVYVDGLPVAEDRVLLPTVDCK